MYDWSVLGGQYSAPKISGEFPGQSNSAAMNSVSVSMMISVPVLGDYDNTSMMVFAILSRNEIVTIW